MRQEGRPRANAMEAKFWDVGQCGGFCFVDLLRTSQAAFLGRGAVGRGYRSEVCTTSFFLRASVWFRGSFAALLSALFWEGALLTRVLLGPLFGAARSYNH